MMTTTSPLLLDVTGVGAGSLVSGSRELIGPLAGAVTPEPLPWDAGTTTSQVVVPDGARYPLVLVTLLADLDEEELLVTVAVVTGGAPAQDLPPVTFAAWSQAGSSVPGCVPAVDAAGVAQGARLVVTGTLTVDGAATLLAADALRAMVRVDLVQGLLGRVLAAMTAGEGSPASVRAGDDRDARACPGPGQRPRPGG